MKKLLLVALASVALVSCKKDIKIKDGNIPQEYKEQAQALVGDYYGDFEGTLGILRVEMADNHPSVQFIGANGEDLLGDPKCHSEFGNLLDATINNKKANRIEGFGFEYTPGPCHYIWGRYADFAVEQAKDGKPKLYVSILAYQTQHQECNNSGVVTDPNGNAHVVPDCHWVTDSHYATGVFKKQ